MRKRILFGLAVVLLLVAGAWLLPIPTWLGKAIEWMGKSGGVGVAVFALIYIVAAVLLLPGSVLALGAGAVFGLLRGAVAVSAGATLGAGAAFLIGRYLARDRVALWVRANPKFAALDAAVGREGGRIVLLTRLSPLFPYNLMNYLFGLTKVGFWPYLLASWIGMLPGTVLYVYLGFAGRAAARVATGPGVGNTWELIFWAIGLVATALLAALLTRLARRALAQEST